MWIGPERVERAPDIVQHDLRGFDPDGDAEHPFAYAEPCPVLGAQSPMRRGRRVRKKRCDVTKRGGKGEIRGPGNECVCRLPAAMQREADHVAVLATQKLCGTSMIRVIIAAWVENTRHGRMARL